MIDDELVLKIERLRDSLKELKVDLRQRYSRRESQVANDQIRQEAARLSEVWMVEVAAREDVRVTLGDSMLGDLNIQFQRLLRYSDHATLRGKYDEAINAINRDFRTRVVLPLKQQRFISTSPQGLPATPIESLRSTFVGHSFAESDSEISDTVVQVLNALGLDVLTGEKPRADSVSKKVRRRIEVCDAFVGIFSRRDRIADREEWTTSAWIIDEKAYAFAKNKRLFLLKENGVESIGGLQGDYEYLEFDRTNLTDLVISLVEMVRSEDSQA
jgi:hypothetical protein